MAVVSIVIAVRVISVIASIVARITTVRGAVTVADDGVAVMAFSFILTVVIDGVNRDVVILIVVVSVRVISTVASIIVVTLLTTVRSVVAVTDDQVIPVPAFLGKTATFIAICINGVNGGVVIAVVVATTVAVIVCSNIILDNKVMNTF